MGTFAHTDLAPGLLDAPPSPAAFPHGVRLAPDRELRVLADGRVLRGGSPMSMVRLRPRAAEMVRRWMDGEPVAERRAERTVARRLVSLGLMHPRPTATAPGALVTMVVPVRDRVEQLARLLSSIGDIRCIVVDDASARGADIEKCARDVGAEYARLERHSGPAAARNARLARVESPFVAFVDSDCVVSPGWLDTLTGYFADPRVALVAPRVVTPSSPSVLGRYEAARSPIDMGPDEGRVRPGSRTPYVPSAAVVLRRSAVTGRAFDERLDAGEDVDLVWRLVEAGWDVRYVPSVEVVHETNLRPLAWLSRRAWYGSTAGPLALRHPGALAPARVTPSVAAICVLLGARRPVTAAAVAVASTAVLATRLAGVLDHPLTEAAELALVGTARGIPPTVIGLTRAWGPALVASLFVRRLGRVRLAAAAALLLTAGRRRDGLDPVRHCAAGLADELAYGAGLWWGCWRARTLRPLLPAVSPPRRRPRRRPPLATR